MANEPRVSTCQWWSHLSLLQIQTLTSVIQSLLYVQCRAECLCLLNLLVILETEVELPHLQMKLETSFPTPKRTGLKKKKKKSYKWKNSFSYTQILFFFLSTWQEDPTFSQKNTENYLGKLDGSLGEKSHQLSKEVVMFCFPIFLIVWIFKSFLPKTQPKSMYLFSRLRNMEASLNFAKRRQLFARPKVYTDSFMQIHLSTPVAQYLSVIAACLFKWWGNIKYHTFSAETGQ